MLVKASYGRKAFFLNEKLRTRGAEEVEEEDRSGRKKQRKRSAKKITMEKLMEQNYA